MLLREKNNEVYEIEYDSRIIPCQIVKSRRKSYGIQVTKEAQVIIKVPLRCSFAFLEEFLEEKKHWVISKYEEAREKKREQENWESSHPLSQKQRKAMEMRYRAAAKEYIPKRVSYYQEIMGGSFEKIMVREQKTRWGSCSTSGTLSFNWRLMLAPPGILDYVVVHELAHLQEMNHSERFWNIVGSVLPDYKERRKWLKENGTKLQYQL